MIPQYSGHLDDPDGVQEGQSSPGGHWGEQREHSGDQHT